MELGSVVSWCGARVGRMDSALASSEAGRRLRQCFSAYASNRKLVGGTLAALALLVFFWPSRSSSGALSPAQLCLSDQLRRWSREEATFDVLVAHSPPRDWEKPYVPFVGNGRFGLGFGKGQEALRLRGGRALSLLTSLTPLVKASLSGPGLSEPAEAVATDYRRGIVSLVTSYQRDGDDCLTVRTNVYAHRRFPKVLVQEVTVENPSDRSVDLAVTRPGKGLANDGGVQKAAGADYQVSSGSVDAGHKSSVTVAAALPSLPGPVSVAAKGSQDLRLLTAIDASEPSEAETEQKSVLEAGLVKALEEAAAQSSGQLSASHGAVWAKLWEPSFGLAFSRAPDVLNPLLINATRYAVLSNVPAYLHEASASPAQRSRWEAQLRQPDMQCFNGHNTLLFPGKLWSALKTAEEVANVAYVWTLTLDKRGGCHQLLEAGADGVALASLLSFGAFKFTKHHLELGAHPSELHREREFGAISYGNDSRISVWVELSEDNKALLYVSARSPRAFFACDAACLDPPVQLSVQRKAFPVKLTEPFTPILYVTAEREHLEELRHSIHVSEVAEAAPLEHHVIALHKHGHRLGGLPWGFWAALALLIAAFHVFLFKLVLAEYCERDGVTKLGTRGTGRYSV